MVRTKDRLLVTGLLGALADAATARRQGGLRWLAVACSLAAMLMVAASAVAGSPTQGSRPELIGRLGRNVFLSTNDGIHGRELWRTDGTSAGTRLVRDIRRGPRSSEPWVVGLVDGALLLSADDGIHGRELWRTDGTARGTQLVRDLKPGPRSSNVDALAVRNGDAILIADDGVHGAEPWTSDGTRAGTRLLRDIRPGRAGSGAYLGVPVSKKTVFLANDGAHGEEPWVTDGTAAGTHLVKDIAKGRRVSSSPEWLGTVEVGLLLLADDGTARGAEPWVTDGTAAGTRLVKDINPVGGNSGMMGSCVGRLDGAASVLLVPWDGVHGYGLWKTDGTPDGTSFVRDLVPTTDDGDVELLRSCVPLDGGEATFFLADDWVHGLEPWTSDGSEDGTLLIRDIAPGAATSQQLGGWFDPTALHGTVLFEADDGVHGPELWRSDGSPDGTGLVRDIVPGPGSPGLLLPERVRGMVVFLADDGIHGLELWRSDGTESGTRLVRDIAPGRRCAYCMPDIEGGWWPYLEVYAFGRGFFFAARDPQHGWELWWSDGTRAGTRLVKDINARPVR